MLKDVIRTSCMNVLNGPLIYSSCLVLAHNLYLHWKFIVLYYLQMASEALKKRGHVHTGVPSVHMLGIGGNSKPITSPSTLMGTTSHFCARSVGCGLRA